MGVGSLMSRGAAAGGKGFRAGLVNAMNNQGMSNELARRIAAGASAAEARKAGQIVGTTALRDNAAIASQAGKIAATQMAREGVQETAQEGLEGYYAKGEGSRAAGRKGELNSADWSGENGIVQQGLQGGAIGLLMGAGGSGVTLRNSFVDDSPFANVLSTIRPSQMFCRQFALRKCFVDDSPIPNLLSKIRTSQKF